MSAQPIRHGSPLSQPSRDGRAGKAPGGPAGDRPHGLRTRRVADYYYGRDWGVDPDQE